eukprot:TRINITY_DN11086_c0_g2_i1.p1 TRINITY_DN11086_c0_g2~~TRINITY_DN11086_c0_g2_i1.p1  ORF type:complete len:150 (+),score=35.70 TRINITY_DN11086_c0_g2_i1:377-826(+)
MKDVAQFLNTRKKKFENISKAAQIFKQLGIENQADDQREFIYEMPLFRGSLPEDQEAMKGRKKRYAFLIFSDCYMITKTKESSVESLKTFPINTQLIVHLEIGKIKISGSTFFSPLKTLKTVKEILKKELGVDVVLENSRGRKLKLGLL